jgi:hypothetical protein
MAAGLEDARHSPDCSRDTRTVRLRQFIRKLGSFTNSRGIFDRENNAMIHAKKMPPVVLALTLALASGLAAPTHAANPAGRTALGFMLAQAMVPPTGMIDANKPMPMEQRYLARYPQPARVGDLIGLPLVNLNASTIGYVRQVVRTPQGKIELVVSYSRLWGWFGRLVAVPIEVVGIEGLQFVSLDIPPAGYEAAPTWHSGDATVLPADAMIRVALART